MIWILASQLRAGCVYRLASGACLYFGACALILKMTPGRMAIAFTAMPDPLLELSSLSLLVDVYSCGSIIRVLPRPKPHQYRQLLR